MNWDDCRLCQHACKCCANRDHKSDCDLCGPDCDKFKAYPHIKYCPENSLPVNKPKVVRPVVIMGSGINTKKDMEESIAKFLKEHPFI